MAAHVSQCVHRKIKFVFEKTAFEEPLLIQIFWTWNMSFCTIYCDKHGTRADFAMPLWYKRRGHPRKWRVYREGQQHALHENSAEIEQGVGLKYAC